MDPGYYFIRLMAVLGLASDIKVPNVEQLKARSRGASVII
jgi:fatty-acid desaturase